jgi:Gpi18-like mannosyltransferase
MDNKFSFIVIIGGVGVAAIILGLLTVGSPEVMAALMTTIVASLISFTLVVKNEDDRKFVMIVWAVALGLRLLMAVVIYGIDLRENIAPDWRTYDFFGNALMQTWQGLKLTGAEWLLQSSATYRSGWGMYYYVAAVYYIIGRNALAIQLLNCIFGASSCILIYRISQLVIPVQRVARLSAVLCALSPSMLIWTSQGVKSR